MKKEIKATGNLRSKKIKELRQFFTEKELFENGILKGRQIKNITEENLQWMIKYGKVDERIYEDCSDE